MLRVQSEQGTRERGTAQIQAQASYTQTLLVKQGDPSQESLILVPGATEKPRAKKRRRRQYNAVEKGQVAAVRKIGACDDCRRKKIKVYVILLHASEVITKHV